MEIGDFLEEPLRDLSFDLYDASDTLNTVHVNYVIEGWSSFAEQIGTFKSIAITADFKNV